MVATRSRSLQHLYYRPTLLLCQLIVLFGPFLRVVIREVFQVRIQTEAIVSTIPVMLVAQLFDTGLPTILVSLFTNGTATHWVRMCDMIRGWIRHNTCAIVDL